MITDLTYLNNMSGGNPEIVKGMIEIFVEQANEYIRDIQQHLDEKNYVALGRLAHKAKSSISIMGMSGLAEELKTLELLARESNEVEKYPAMVENFINLCRQAIEELSGIALKL
jgi:HPt (histidine-containing phosphotransfer) domain-containing protein